MFVTDRTDVIDQIPGHPGYAVTIRRLRRKELRDAAFERQKTGIANMQALGGPAVLRELFGGDDSDAKADALKEKAGLDAEAKAKAEADVLTTFDADTVLSKGVVGFSGENVPVGVARADLIDLLQDDAASYIAREIIAYSRGERAKDQADEKND